MMISNVIDALALPQSQSRFAQCYRQPPSPLSLYAQRPSRTVLDQHAINHLNVERSAEGKSGTQTLERPSLGRRIISFHIKPLRLCPETNSILHFIPGSGESGSELDLRELRRDLRTGWLLHEDVPQHRANGIGLSNEYLVWCMLKNSGVARFLVIIRKWRLGLFRTISRLHIWIRVIQKLYKEIIQNSA